MKSIKRLGIWMDHSVAHIIELENNNIVSETIEAETIVNEEDIEINWKDESSIHNKEQYNLSHYFKKLINVIKDYDEVLLFGPTDAKNELFNLIDHIHHMDMIKIAIKTTDKMPEDLRQAFVMEHFNKSGQLSKNLKKHSFFFF
jgi:hypothetical protein